MYPPGEDSFFLSEVLSNYFLLQRKTELNKLKNKKALDMGTGSGIQAETLAKFIEKKNILCVDIDSEAVNYARKKGFSAIKNDLFGDIKGKFDFIIFNAPYLPEDEFDNKKDTTGGKEGDEIILRFLIRAGNHLEKEGRIFLLLSSTTPRKRIMQEIKKQNLQIMEKFERKLFFEKLEILIISAF